MPKQITKLTDASALRARLEAERLPSAREHQRLAARLAELAPLTLEAVPLNEPDQPAALMLPDQSVPSEVAAQASAGLTPEQKTAPPPLPATPPPIPSTALVVSQSSSRALTPVQAPGPLMRLDGAPPPLPSLVIYPAIPRRRRRMGFLTGLSIALAVGAALYAILISAT